jgi:type II secretion system protein N
MKLPQLPRVPKLDQLEWATWRPRLAYGGFALIAFLLALRWTFPAEAVRERLILEAGLRGWQFEAGELAPGGLLGVHARDVRLEEHAGLAIPIDEITASLRVLPLLIGRQVLVFDGRVYEGRVRGTAGLSGDVRDVSLRVEDLELSRAIPLKKATGMDLQGKLGGTADLAVPMAPAEHTTGRIDLAVAGAGIAGGQLPLPGMVGGLTLPKVALGAVTAAVKLAGGKAEVERLEARGGDAEVATEGLSVTLQPALEHAPLFGKARLRIQPALWERGGTPGLRGLAEAALQPARAPDGSYLLQVVGTLGHPRVIMTPGAR